MATYAEVQGWVKENEGFVPKTCWIAHVLSDYGRTTRHSPNRIDPLVRVHPCPTSKRAAIEAALLHFKMI
jgi:hypothetical protein